MSYENETTNPEIARQMVANVEELVSVLKALKFPEDTPEYRLMQALDAGLRTYKNDVLKET